MFWDDKLLLMVVVCFGLFITGFYAGSAYVSRGYNKKISALKKTILTQKRHHDTVLQHYKTHHGQHPDCPHFPGYPPNYPNGYDAAPVEISAGQERPDRNERRPARPRG